MEAEGAVLVDRVEPTEPAGMVECLGSVRVGLGSYLVSLLCCLKAVMAIKAISAVGAGGPPLTARPKYHTFFPPFSFFEIYKFVPTQTAPTPIAAPIARIRSTSNRLIGLPPLQFAA